MYRNKNIDTLHDYCLISVKTYRHTNKDTYRETLRINPRTSSVCIVNVTWNDVVWVALIFHFLNHLCIVFGLIYKFADALRVLRYVHWYHLQRSQLCCRSPYVTRELQKHTIKTWSKNKMKVNNLFLKDKLFQTNVKEDF